MHDILNCRRFYSVTHYCFHFLQLGYKLIKSRISFYNQKTIYSRLQEYPRGINKEDCAGRVDLSVNYFAVILFGFVFLTFQNRRVIGYPAIAFPQDTQIGHILHEVESLSVTATPFHFLLLLRILFFQPFLKIYIWNREIEILNMSLRINIIVSLLVIEGIEP